MKKLLHQLVKKAGYQLSKRDFMPSGISLERDMSQTIDLLSIKTVFDIGANKGDMALYFNEVFPNATISAFEPISSTYQLLVSACRSQSKIKPIQLGFAEEAGSVKVYLQTDHGLNSINNFVNKPDEKNGGKYEEIQLDTLDGYCKKNNIERIDLLKTDAEGLDLKIIKGAEGMLNAGKIKFILAEVGFNEDNLRNTFFEELRVYLYNKGFKIRGFYDQSNYGNLPYMTCANALFILQDK
jgi:FkbM family methyltransferase